MTGQVTGRFSADILGRLLTFALIYIVQRHLGPAEYGWLALGLAAGAVLAPLADGGVSLILTRELAAAPDRSAQRRLVSMAFALRIPFTIGAAAVLLLMVWWRPGPAPVATVLLGMSVVLGAAVDLVGAVFRGLGRIGHEALLLLTSRVVALVVGVAAMATGVRLLGIAQAFMGATVVSLVIGLIWMRRSAIAPRPAFASAATLVGPALPLGGAVLFSMAYIRTGLFVLDATAGGEAVGAFAVAQRLIEPMAILPASVLAAVFPAYSSRRLRETAAAHRLRTRTIAVLAATGGTIGVAAVAGAPGVIALLYGDQFPGAAPVLRVLAFSIVLTFVNYGLTHFLVASGGQRVLLLLNVTVFACNLGLCLILVPAYGPPGAAAAIVFTEALLLVLCAAALRTAEAR